jgi:hypothetical protein
LRRVITYRETIAASKVGAPVEVTIARSITRLPTLSPCGCNPVLRIHATDTPGEA